MNTAIEFKNIKKAYGNKVVLERFNFSVAKGEFVTMRKNNGFKNDKWPYRADKR